MQTDIKLSDVQQQVVLTECSRGVPLHDALVLCKFKQAQIEQLIHQQDVQELYLQARAEGQSIIRKRLMDSAHQGNVSAMNTLRLMDDPEKEDDKPAVAKKSKAQLQVEYLKWKAELDAQFNRFVECSMESYEVMPDGTHRPIFSDREKQEARKKLYAQKA